MIDQFFSKTKKIIKTEYGKDISIYFGKVKKGILGKAQINRNKIIVAERWPKNLVRPDVLWDVLLHEASHFKVLHVRAFQEVNGEFQATKVDLTDQKTFHTPAFRRELNRLRKKYPFEEFSR